MTLHTKIVILASFSYYNNEYLKFQYEMFKITMYIYVEFYSVLLRLENPPKYGIMSKLRNSEFNRLLLESVLFLKICPFIL